MLIDLSGGFHSAYAGLVVYFGMPAVVLFGACVMLFGAFLTHLKRKKTGHDSPLPAIDLNVPHVLRRFIIINIVLLMVVAATGVGVITLSILLSL